MKKTKNVKKMTALAISAALAAGALMGCGGSSSGSSAASAGKTERGSTAVSESSKKESYRIGVLQYMPHAALDSANEGFFAALDELGVAYEADQQNAAGEQANCQTIGEQLVNDGNDLIFAFRWF